MGFILPPTIALKSVQCHYYLTYTNDSDSEVHGFLRFSGSNVFSPLAKFQVVTANTGTGLVHIRCIHNNKFIQQKGEGSRLLSPEADEPDEDPSKWSCTLFEPVEAGRNQVRLRHQHLSQLATVSSLDIKNNLELMISASTDEDVFDVIDLESMVILPKHVSFKGDNDLYLQLVDSYRLSFTSTDKRNAESWFEVSTDGSDGSVEIKAFNSVDKKYLCVDDHTNAIFAGETPDKFWPVRIENKCTVALKYINNNKFCGRYTESSEDYPHPSGVPRYVPNINDGLCASFVSISPYSPLRLEELVLSRRIYDTKFDIQHAIIYGETPVTMATSNASNDTLVDSTVELKFGYKDSKSSTWSASHSWMVAASVSAEFSVPFVGGGKVTAEAQYSGSYTWGETVSSESTLETTYTLTVPAKTSISVGLIATRGQCDVPFSYYQRDVLYNGEIVIYKKEDGLYTGINSYNFSYNVATTKHSGSIADLPNRGQKLPDPSTGQNIPLPMPSGSITIVEQELRVDDEAQASFN